MFKWLINLLADKKQETTTPRIIPNESVRPKETPSTSTRTTRVTKGIVEVSRKTKRTIRNP